MRRLFSTRIAAFGLLVIFCSVIIFHILVLTGIIPFDMVWGGRLQSKEEMIRFESVSIALNLIMILAVFAYLRIFKFQVNKKVLHISFWIMFVLFLFNTAGNLFSNNELEKLIFTPITLLLSVFSLRLAID